MLIVVGAGPTGLALGCELARRGVEFRLVDGKAGTSTVMKATALTPTSLEFFEDLGMLDRCLETGQRVRHLALYAEGRKIVERGWDSLDSPHPFMLLLGQNYTERFLEERLRALGGRVEWGTRLVGLEEGPRVRLEYADGRLETLEPRFVVGCDGSKSEVARACGAKYRDLDFPTDYAVAELEVDAALPREDWMVFFAETGPLAAGAMPENRWGIMLALPPGKQYLGSEPTLEELQGYWDERSPFPGKLSNPQWMAYFRTHARVLQSKLPAGVVLAGDAAHQVSPLSSLGMNSGLLDARNLAWKLELSWRGRARPLLLESFASEHLTLLEPGLVLSVINEFVYPARNLLLRKYRDLSYQLMLNFEPIWRFYTRYQSQKERSLRRSPVVAQELGLPVGRAHLNVSAWLAFGEGPHAGDPWRDVPGLVEAATGREVRLYETLFGGRQTLLIFGACQQALEAFGQLEELLASLPDGLLRAVFVQRGPTSVWKGEVLLDPEGHAHARYGAEEECVYLMRPDGFVGYRSMPIAAQGLRSYLDRLFVL